MTERFEIPYPEKPPASWNPTSVVDGEEQGFAIDGDENAVTADFISEEELLSDEELYAQPSVSSATSVPGSSTTSLLPRPLETSAL
jgi:hypothetical protein